MPRITSLPGGQNVAPLGTDAIITERAGSSTAYAQFGDMNLLPDGTMLNGKIEPTVSSNNLTVALKTLKGDDPSATDPVSIWINGGFRHIAAALSVTKAAGTNWCASGSAMLATQEIDYFAYLLWNTGGTDSVDIAFSRFPGGRVVSDFSATTTAEKYLAYGKGDAPASTDDAVVIGRFAATLSAGAGYTWTVPTYTNVNLVRRPIFETRPLTWTATTATITGMSAVSAGVCRYRIVNGSHLLTAGRIVGTSNATGFSILSPWTAETLSGIIWGAAVGDVTDNTANVAAGDVYIGSAGTSLTFRKSAAATWTNSGTKAVVFTLGYDI